MKVSLTSTWRVAEGGTFCLNRDLATSAVKLVAIYHHGPHVAALNAHPLSVAAFNLEQKADTYW